MTPVFVAHFVSVVQKPRDILQTNPFYGLALKPSPSAKRRMALPQMDEFARKVQQLVICFFPVHPRSFVVLALGIVVSLLGPAQFIAGNEHRNTLG